MKTTTVEPKEIGRGGVKVRKMRRNTLKSSLVAASVAVLGIGGALADDSQGKTLSSRFNSGVSLRACAHPGRMDNPGIRRRATTSERKVVANRSYSKSETELNGAARVGRINNRGVSLLVRSKQRVVRLRVKNAE